MIWARYADRIASLAEENKELRDEVKRLSELKYPLYCAYSCGCVVRVVSPEEHKASCAPGDDTE